MSARPRAVYVVGAPGVGKSTLLMSLLEPWHVMPDVPLRGVLRGHPLVLRADGETQGMYLGRQRPNFPGTDALSMGVMPDAVRWATEYPLPSLVLGEGARLGTPAFVGLLALHTDLTLVHLVASDEALNARRAVRGSQQNDAWARGVRTTASRAAHEAETCLARVLELDTTSLSPGEVFARVRAVIGC